MRYAVIDSNRIIKNIIEVEPELAAEFGALYLGNYHLGMGDCYPDVELTEPGELEILQAENKTLKAQVNALSEQQAFYEDCIAEMASVVYA